MNSPITLTTDFGLADSYVAQMKGVILGINPQACIVDVTHTVPPQDIRHASLVLAEAVGAFPAGTIHVAVVDPGVGTDRALIAAAVGEQRFVAPDNGVLSEVLRGGPQAVVHRLENRRLWRASVSSTFHGRDIMAPVAAHWSLGKDISEFGPRIDPAALTVLPAAASRRERGTLIGEVELVDGFGNVVTNVRAADLAGRRLESLVVAAGGWRIEGIVRAYGERPAGTAVALVGSSGRLEIAVVGGNAARELGLARGAEVRIEERP